LPLPDGRVLALDYYSNAASFLDLDAGTAESVDLAGGPAPCQNPTHAALDAAGRSAWIVCSGPEGRLVALDLERRRVARTVPVAGLSFDITVLPGWAR
jgi:hypothetical protein